LEQLRDAVEDPKVIVDEEHPRCRRWTGKLARRLRFTRFLHERPPVCCALSKLYTLWYQPGDNQGRTRIAHAFGRVNSGVYGPFGLEIGRFLRSRWPTEHQQALRPGS